MQFSSIEFPPAVHMLPGMGLILTAYMQPSDIRPLPKAYKQPSSATPGEYIQLLGPISAAYI